MYLYNPLRFINFVHRKDNTIQRTEVSMLRVPHDIVFHHFEHLNFKRGLNDSFSAVIMKKLQQLRQIVV